MCIKKKMHSLIVLLYVCNIAGGDDNGDISFTNVGSVLFSKRDIWRSHWSKREINVLRSRMMFENIIPDPETLNIIDEKFLSNLLSYCNKLYKTVIKDSHDAESEIVLTTALSDAIGGYVHIYILPATTLGYYAGSITATTLTQVQNFDQELLRFLRTDGTGWSMPYLAKYSAVVPYSKIEIKPKKRKDSCDQIAFYEKSPEGLIIPIPRINYRSEHGMIFIPMKNETLHSLSDTKTSDTIYKYYDVVLSCLESKPDQLSDFKGRFQGWIDNEVLPHMMETNTTYYGFGKVLGLANDTKTINEKLSNNPRLNLQLQQLNEMQSSCNMCFYKIGIVLAILFVELIWCIVAICVWCAKRRRRTKSSKRGDSCSTVAHCMESGLFDNSSFCNEKLRKIQAKEGKSNKKPFGLLSTRRSSFKIDTLYKAPMPSKLSIATETRTSTITQHCSAFPKSTTNTKRSDSQATSKKLDRTKSSKCIQKANSISHVNIQCKPSMISNSVSEQIKTLENNTTDYDVQYFDRATSKIGSKVRSEKSNTLMLFSTKSKDKDCIESISSEASETKTYSSRPTRMQFVCDSCLDVDDGTNRSAKIVTGDTDEPKNDPEALKLEGDTSHVYFSPTTTESIETVFRTLKSSENTTTPDENESHENSYLVKLKAHKSESPKHNVTNKNTGSRKTLKEPSMLQRSSQKVISSMHDKNLSSAFKPKFPKGSIVDEDNLATENIANVASFQRTLKKGQENIAEEQIEETKDEKKTNISAKHSTNRVDDHKPDPNLRTDDNQPIVSKPILKEQTSRRSTITESISNSNQTTITSINYSIFKEGITGDNRGLTRQSTGFNSHSSTKEVQQEQVKYESQGIPCKAKSSYHSSLRIVDDENVIKGNNNSFDETVYYATNERPKPKISRIPKPIFNPRNIPIFTATTRIRCIAGTSKIPQPVVKAKYDDDIFITKKRSVKNRNTTF